MRCAYNLTRSDIHYRHESFSAGLSAAGFEVRKYNNQPARPGDVLLIWNRYAHLHDLATRFEKQGGIVVVAENGYLGMDENGLQNYALARHAHNGAGTWNIGETDRFAALGIELKPWREIGNHILVCPNRSFGMPGMMMPPNWANEARKRLQKITNRDIRVRPHPGNIAPKKPLIDDLAGAWAVVIWASSAGVQALVHGIPVISESPFWICKSACIGFDELESPGQKPDRLSALKMLAWAQWTLAEIESGLAFRTLLC